jgi:hypothetical protein
MRKPDKEFYKSYKNFYYVAKLSNKKFKYLLQFIKTSKIMQSFREDAKLCKKDAKVFKKMQKFFGAKFS